MEKFKNNSSVSIRENSSWITIRYYAFSISASLIYFFWSGMRPGVLSSLLIIAILLDYLIKGKKMPTDKLSIFVFMFIFYNISSIFIALLRGFALTVSLTVFLNGVLPVLLYFIGLSSDVHSENKFVKTFIYSTVMMLALGLLLYVTYPDVYHNYLMRSIYNYSTYQDYYRLNPRLNSFTNSIVSGSLGAMSITFLTYHMINGTKIVKYQKLLLLLAVISTILTMQRSAWLFMLFSMIFIIVRNAKFKAKTSKIIIFIIILIFVYLVIRFFNKGLVDVLILRMLSLSGAISERNAEWGLLFDRSVNSFLIGDGLGTRSHQAIEFNSLTIRDGYYIKLLFELGVVGGMFFTSIVLLSLINGLKKGFKFLPYFCIVFGVLLQAVGSNILDFQLIAPMFWFSIGKLNQRESN